MIFMCVWMRLMIRKRGRMLIRQVGWNRDKSRKRVRLRRREIEGEDEMVSWQKLLEQRERMRFRTGGGVYVETESHYLPWLGCACFQVGGLHPRHLHIGLVGDRVHEWDVVWALRGQRHGSCRGLHVLRTDLCSTLQFSPAAICVSNELIFDVLVATYSLILASDLFASSFSSAFMASLAFHDLWCTL